MRNRTMLLLILPAMLASAALAVGLALPAERRAVAGGRPPRRALVWPLTLMGAVAGLLLGAVVGVLAARAAGHADLGRGAMDGAFLLVPGMLVGLAAGCARWATIRLVRRRARPRRRLRRRPR